MKYYKYNVSTRKLYILDVRQEIVDKTAYDVIEYYDLLNQEDKSTTYYLKNTLATSIFEKDLENLKTSEFVPLNTFISSSGYKMIKDNVELGKKFLEEIGYIKHQLTIGSDRPKRKYTKRIKENDGTEDNTVAGENS